jgi:hypothetical protein
MKPLSSACRLAALSLIGCMLSASPAHGQGAGHYRDFQLGDNLASVSASTGVARSEAQIVHQRPAILQELQWRRPYLVDGVATADPVQQIAFSFYNDQLFRLVIDYDRDRTEGLTDVDMVDAISAIYGPPVKLTPKTNPVVIGYIQQQSGTRVAGWSSADYTAVLYRSSYASGFRMIVTSVRLGALARAAETQALRLDERDAPRRERARQKEEADAARAAQEKARLANKAAFRP